jgi:hypothetical protein
VKSAVSNKESNRNRGIWRSLGCVSERGGLDIVGGHSRIQGSEQIMKRAIQPKLADAPRFLVLSLSAEHVGPHANLRTASKIA